MIQRWLDRWSPWRLRRALAVAREDVRRYDIHLYACNVQRDWAEALLTEEDRERLRATWRRNEAEIVADARADVLLGVIGKALTDDNG